MPRRVVVFSDLSNQMVPEGREASIIVRQHPMLTEIKQIEAGEDEIKELLADDSQFVLMDITTRDITKQVVVDLPTFNALFEGDPYAVLKDAPRVKVASAAGSRPKKSKDELETIRAWCRENGWPDLKDRGRIPSDAQAKYDAAHLAEA